MWNRKPSGLTARFGALLALAGTVSMLLFGCVYLGGTALLERYFEDSGFQTRLIEKRIADLQGYVSRYDLAARDAAGLTHWVKKQPLVLLEIYRSNVLLYSSSAPEELLENEEEAPSYDWVSYYEIDFADGPAEAVIYANDTFRWTAYLTIGAVFLSCLLFLLIFLRGCRKIVAYICQLSREIQAMEGGDLDVPITFQGDHELTQLAKSLDAMRQAFKEQREREAAAFRANQTMITEMSHDLRTPLTALQIYTDILRFRKYNPGQLGEYLEKVDAKASQIKQLTENIFEYSLISREQAVRLEPPMSLRGAFHDVLSEMAAYLGQQGFSVQPELDWPDAKTAVYPPYVKRLIDNITSNIVKYADPVVPVLLEAGEAEDGPWLAVQNAVRPDAAGQESTQIGLSNMRTMMEKMGGCCQIYWTPSSFRVKLSFPKISEGEEK